MNVRAVQTASLSSSSSTLASSKPTGQAPVWPLVVAGAASLALLCARGRPRDAGSSARHVLGSPDPQPSREPGQVLAISCGSSSVLGRNGNALRLPSQEGKGCNSVEGALCPPSWLPGRCLLGADGRACSPLLPAYQLCAGRTTASESFSSSVECCLRIRQVWLKGALGERHPQLTCLLGRSLCASCFLSPRGSCGLQRARSPEGAGGSPGRTPARISPAASPTSPGLPVGPLGVAGGSRGERVGPGLPRGAHPAWALLGAPRSHLG